jgi:Flp pilus assembly protein TadG
VLVMLCIFVYGIVDFSRAIYDVEVMTNLAGEGSSMASRGVSPAKTATAIATYAGQDLSMGTNGCVIVTAVTCTTNPCNGGITNLQVTAQSSQCAITVSSKVGCLKGQGSCGTSNAVLPTNAALALQLNQSLYVTEVFYTYSTVTPIGAFLGSSVLPGQLYSAAYY